MSPARPSPVGRYVLRFRGPAAPEADLATIRAAAGVVIVDDGGRTLLVEGEATAIAALSSALVGWTVARETITPPPGAPPTPSRAVRGRGSPGPSRP